MRYSLRQISGGEERYAKAPGHSLPRAIRASSYSNGSSIADTICTIASIEEEFDRKEVIGATMLRHTSHSHRYTGTIFRSGSVAMLLWPRHDGSHGNAQRRLNKQYLSPLRDSFIFFDSINN